MRARVNILLGLLLLVPVAGAQTSGGAMPHADDVWVKFSLTENLHTRAEVESGVTEFTAGTHRRPALLVVNNGSAPIRNVTLTLVPRNLTLDDYAFGSTRAGEAAGRLYAWWPQVNAGEGKLAGLDLWVSQEATGPFVLQALLFFEDEQGKQWHSVTNIHGLVPTGPAVNAVPAGGLLPLSGAFAIAVGMCGARLRRQ